MRKIEIYPSVDDVKILEWLSKKSAPHLSRAVIHANRKRIHAAYLRYECDFGSPKKMTERKLGLSTVGVVFREKYRSGSKTGHLKFLAVLRHENKCVCCPFCGGATLGTVDHYLPKEIEGFGHFAIFSKNLVPMCYSCQRIKGSYTPESSRRRIIHPYFDSLCGIAELEILPILGQDLSTSPTFAFRVRSLKRRAKDAPLIRTFESHVRLMRLKDRPDLRKELRCVWQGLLKSTVTCLRTGGSVEIHIRQKLQDARSELRVDDDPALVEVKFEVTLLKSILLSKNVMNWIESFAVEQVQLELPPKLVPRVISRRRGR